MGSQTVRHNCVTNTSNSLTFEKHCERRYNCVCLSVLHSVVSNSLRPHGLQPTRLLCPWNSLGKSIGVDCHSFLQGIFLTQGLNTGLLHCRQILYCLSHQGSLIYMYMHVYMYIDMHIYTFVYIYNMHTHTYICVYGGSLAQYLFYFAPFRNLSLSL